MLNTKTSFYKRATYLVTLTTLVLLGCSNNETAKAENNVTTTAKAATPTKEDT